MEPESLIGETQIREMCALAKGTPPGCFVEVGVYKGGSAFHLAKLAQDQDRKVFLYDTFTGIPFADEIDSHLVGDFSETSFESVKATIPYANIIQGIFPQSMVKMPPVAFAHIDADQYRSIKESIEALLPQMVLGGVMVFDDYNCLRGANTAVDEKFAGHITFTPSAKAVVKITEALCQLS